MQDKPCEHIVQCWQKEATDIFMAAFAELRIWLQKTTSPEIEAVITDAVLAYKETIDMDLEDYEDTEVIKAL